MERGLEGSGKVPRIVQVMYFKGGPRQLNQQPEAGLPQQWEAQWQEFLNTLQPTEAGWENLQLTNMEPWDDAQAFLMAFEQVAKACQWPREEWVRQLLPALRGGMEQFFCRLDTRDRSDYVKVKAAILRAEAFRMEMKRQHFRQCCYQELEGPRRVYSQLQDLCHQWLKPDSHTKEQILEMIIQEQLLGMLPTEAQNWVRECGPKDCVEMVTLAEDFLMGHRHVPRTCDWQVPLPEASVSSLEAEGRQRQPYHPGASEMTPARNSVLAHPSSSGLEMAETRTSEGPVLVKEELGLDPKPIHWEVMRGSGSSSSALESEGLLVPTPEVNSQTDEPQATFQERPEHGDQIPTALFGEEESRSTCPLQQNIKLEEDAGAYSPCDDQLSPPDYQEEGETANEASEQQNKKMHACTKCGYQAEKLSDILKHFRVHNKEKPYRYLDCGNSFGLSSNLMKHQQIHTANQQTAVPNVVIAECDVTLSDDEELINFLGKKKTPRQEAGSQNCPKRSSKRSPAAVPPRSASSKLEASERNRKGKSVPRANNTKKARHEGLEKKHLCLYCGHRAYYLSDLMRHKNSHPKGTPYKCPDCEKIFAQPSFLKLHLKTHKSGRKPMKMLKAPQGERKYTCSKCGHKTYKLSTHLLHVRAHVGEKEKSYICDECGRDFTKSSNLSRHKRIHSRKEEDVKIRRPSFTHDKEINRSYEEPKKTTQVPLKKIGGRSAASTAASMAALRKHWRNYKRQQKKKAVEKQQKTEEKAKENIEEKETEEKHTPELSLRARLEKFAYSKNRGKEDSAEERAPDPKVSAEELPQECTVCGKNFTYDGQLTDHQNLHTEAKPHRCNECQK